MNLLNSEIVVKGLTWIGVPTVFTYLCSMVIYPIWATGGDWLVIQNVWARWQGLNVAMIAFTSSIVAFNISRINEIKQRERNFSAERAFLPSALSDLSTYFQECSKVLTNLWEHRPENQTEPMVPMVPKDTREVFRQCIRFADPSVGQYLSQILVRLQIHCARLEDTVADRDDRHNLIVYLYRLGELQALTNKLFDFARGEKTFDDSSLILSDFRAAYLGFGLYPDRIGVDKEDTLIKFTQCQISNHLDPK